MGYPDQGHSQGSDITHVQHGHPEARSQLRLQGHRSERLRLRLPESTFSFYIWWAFKCLLIGKKKKWYRINFQTKWNPLKVIQTSQEPWIPIFSPLSSPKSVAFLRGVVVPGRGGFGGAHLHPAAGFHPHYQRTEQEVRQEVGIRWAHTIAQLNGAFNSRRSGPPFF